MNNRHNRIFLLFMLVLSMALLAGCGSSSNGNGGTNRATYEVTVTNITNNQPLSPLGIVVHMDGYLAWKAGTAASNGLEQLAEGGDPTAFLIEAELDDSVSRTVAGTGIIVPGGSETVSITTNTGSSRMISLATMLVNTNDAFTGIESAPVGTLSKGESLVYLAHAYDAGTEANTETAATVPGPAGGGTGYDATRDDTDFVFVHAGVVTADDGLGSSTLDESHRFIGPVSRIEITRVN